MVEHSVKLIRETKEKEKNEEMILDKIIAVYKNAKCVMDEKKSQKLKEVNLLTFFLR